MIGMRQLLRRFGADQRGNVAIMAAGGMILAVCCAALGVDIGSISADRRKAQSAADLAAIVAASNLGNAVNAAKSAITKNNLPVDALVGVELGTYTADASIPADKRFVTPAVGIANAARVSLQTSTPLYFSKFFTGSQAFSINSHAIAASTQITSFAVGSRLASLNGGVLNAVLGQLLGTTLSLSLMDYQALATARIDAFQFLSALATRVGITAGTYDTVLNANAKVGDILAAALAAQHTANGASTATTALSMLSQSAATLTTKISPLALIDAGPYADLTIGTKPKTGVSVSLLDLIQATAGIARGASQVNAGLDLNIPGIASVQLIASIGERPQGSSWVAVGTQGVSVHTAQTRVLLQIKLLGTGSVSAVNLPVYVEVGTGTVTLNKASCGYPDISTSTVTLGVTPGLVDAWIANVSAADVKNVTTAPNPGPATLVDLGLVTVTGRAHAQIGNTTPTNVTFNYSDITSQTKKTVNSANFTSSLVGSLLGNLNLTVNVLGLGLPLAGLGSLVAGILSAATGAVDQLLVAVLSSLGVGLGQADVWVSGIRCDGAVLVN